MEHDATAASERAEPPIWSSGIIALMTLAWIVACAALFSWGFDIGFDLSGEPLPSELRAELDHLTRILIVVFVTGPAVIAVFAAAARRPWAAVVYFVIALALTCWTASQQEVRELFGPPTVEVEQPERDHCIPISGSDRTCPGG